MSGWVTLLVHQPTSWSRGSSDKYMATSIPKILFKTVICGWKIHVDFEDKWKGRFCIHKFPIGQKSKSSSDQNSRKSRSYLLWRPLGPRPFYIHSPRLVFKNEGLQCLKRTSWMGYWQSRNWAPPMFNDGSLEQWFSGLSFDAQVIIGN